jgi:hypothetical protein
MSLVLSNTFEVPEPSQWPISLGRFGTSPFGQNLYRMVYAPTVRKLIFGTNSVGVTGAHVRPAYRHLGDVWILEKWISGAQACQMTPTEYENYGPRCPQSGMLLEGPYPTRGLYAHCWTFDADTLQNGIEGAIDKIIGLIRAGEGKSLAEIKAGNAELDAKNERTDAANRFLRVRETESCFGIRPASLPGGPRVGNQKSLRNPITADKTGLPTKRGSVMAMKGPTLNGSI